MLTTERFLQTNDNWGDRVEYDKTWADWKAEYKKSHAKARIKAQANEGSVKFGLANSAARLEITQCLETNQCVDEEDMKALEG